MHFDVHYELEGLYFTHISMCMIMLNVWPLLRLYEGGITASIYDNMFNSY